MTRARKKRQNSVLKSTIHGMGQWYMIAGQAGPTIGLNTDWILHLEIFRETDFMQFIQKTKNLFLIFIS